MIVIPPHSCVDIPVARLRLDANEVKMGTDIRIIVERQIGAEWVAVNTMTTPFLVEFAAERVSDPVGFPAQARNYARFAALAGVRGDGPRPKGFPPNVSTTARHVFARDGGHSASWLSLSEAVQIFLETEAAFIRETVPDPEYLYFDVEKSEVSVHRIVFGSTARARSKSPA